MVAAAPSPVAAVTAATGRWSARWAAVTNVLHPRTVAWGGLWFLVVVVFTAGVGTISAAMSAGHMPPLTPSIQSVIEEQPTGPSSAPTPGILHAR